MLSFFEPLKKLFRVEKVAIDNVVFRLHYKVTVIMFILGSVLLNGKQYFGDPIDCHVDTGVPAKLVSTFCWATGTFTLRQQTGRFMAHQGVGPSVGKERIYHTYYQWVGFIMFFQAILFYLPRHLWKIVEGGRIKMCAVDMKQPVIDHNVVINRVDRLHSWFIKFQNRNNTYAMKFFLFEIINLSNVIMQIFYINKFLGGRFLKYGVHTLNYYNNIHTGVDPMAEVFPKVTKCTFNTHSINGDLTGHDALCVLPLNIVNEKVYLIMWFWLIVLAVTSSLSVLYRAAAIIFPVVRTFMLYGENSKWQHVADACKNGKYGDWFLLRQLSKNVDPETFAEFLKKLSKESSLSWDTNSNQTLRSTTLISPQSWVGGFFRGGSVTPPSELRHQHQPADQKKTDGDLVMP